MSNRTPRPTIPTYRSASYVCLSQSQFNELCLKLPTGGYQAKVDELPMPFVLGNATSNENKPARGLLLTADYTKSRFDLNYANETITYSLDGRFCVDGVSNSRKVQLDVCRRNPVRGIWDLSPLRLNPSMPTQIVHRFTRQCLTVMECRRIAIDRTRYYCDRNVEGLSPATKIAAGNVLGLHECLVSTDAAFASQSFSQIRECSPGCAPSMVGDGTCNLLCYNERCNWDSQCRADCAPSDYDCGTPSPTVPTMSPTSSPSGTPSATPSQSPSVSAPSVSPSVSAPTAAPSRSPSSAPRTSGPSMTPTNSPSGTPTYTNPSVSPSFSPSFAPSFAPTNSPSVSPSFAPSFAPSVAPTRAAAAFPIWAIVLIAVLGCCCFFLIGLCFRAKRNPKKRDEIGDPESPEYPTPEPSPEPEPKPAPPTPQPTEPMEPTEVLIDVSDTILPQEVPSSVQRAIQRRADLYAQIRRHQGADVSGRSFFRWIKSMYAGPRSEIPFPSRYTPEHEETQRRLHERYGRLSDDEIQRKTKELRCRLNDYTSNLLEMEDRYTRSAMRKHFPGETWSPIDFELLDRIVDAHKERPDETFADLRDECARRAPGI